MTKRPIVIKKDIVTLRLSKGRAAMMRIVTLNPIVTLRELALRLSKGRATNPF
jgi:hypothetical protein